MLRNKTCVLKNKVGAKRCESQETDYIKIIVNTEL